jgi:hypothetical protein
MLIAPGATLTVPNAGSIYLTSRTLENGGTILWTGGGAINLTSVLITNRVGGLFDAQGAASLSGSSSRLDNAGTFRKSVSTGTTTVGVPLNNFGTNDIRSGFLAANGGYTSSGSALLNCAIGGTLPGTNYGRVQVTGAVTLNGALSVDLSSGYVPTTNDSFTVLTAGTRTGSFASFSYPSNQVTMQLSNTTSSVIVRVTAVAASPPPPPLLLQPVLSTSNVVLTWTAVSNITYRLEFNPDLSPSNWSALPGDVTSLSNFASKLDSLTPTNRFYRVHVLP